MSTSVTRCDLHLHSDASLTTGEWFSEYFGCPESYADPLEQYELCKSRGMELVTLTDHDSIEGGLRLMGKPDFFLSEEVTTRFPENDCLIHVLAWNITPAQHQELQRLRQDVYALSRYLRSEQLAHALAHPMLSPNWKMDAPTMEKCLVLFPTIESVNGLMDRRTTPDIDHLLRSSTPRVLEALSRKHGLPLATGGNRLALCAGSDDHVHRRCGTIHAEVQGALDPAGFLSRLMQGDARPVGATGNLDAMAVCVQRTTHEHFRRRGLEGDGQRNPFVDAVDIVAGRSPAGNGTDSDLASLLLSRLASAASPQAAAIGPELDLLHQPVESLDEADRKVIGALGKVSDELSSRALTTLGGAVLRFDVYGVISSLLDLATALTAQAPYLFAADHFARQEEQVRRIWEGWTAFPPYRHQEHMAVFSDSLDRIDGVATWCKRFREQARQAGCPVWFARCARPGAEDGLATVARFDLPVYQGFELAVPSLSSVVDGLWRRGVTHVELATPGPMGLVGLAAAKLLRLPVTASYHTELPDLVQTLTSEPKAAELVRGFLGWFYRSVDRVFAFSEQSRAKLVAMGVPEERIELVLAAVDPTHFAPERASRTAFQEFGVARGERPIILSVGRVSAEKNIPLILEAVERLQSRPNAPHLVIVGDGPERAELEETWGARPFVTFTGYREGEALGRLYASSDVFVFASTLDTLGLVNLEAMASGLPILVPSGSAIAEQLADGKTALFYGPEPEALAATLAKVLDSPAQAARLGANGRQEAVRRWAAAGFGPIWKRMVSPRRGREAGAAAA
jgi:glycosyltransferase involved in cell wall biosynthesis